VCICDLSDAWLYVIWSITALNVSNKLALSLPLSCYRELGEEKCKEWYNLTGTVIHTCYALPQLLHFYRPDNIHNYQRVYKWQSLASICLSRWIGVPYLPISYSEASWTGMLNWRKCEYEQELMSRLPEDCRQTLPDLIDFDQLDLSAYKGTRSQSLYATRWPELFGADTRFFLSLGDGACANIGSKCTVPGRIACTIGTSAAARVCMYNEAVLSSHEGSPRQLDSPSAATSDSSNNNTIYNNQSQSESRIDIHAAEKESSDVTIPPGLFTYRIDRRHILVGGALTDGGSVVEWVQKLLNLDSAGIKECLDQVTKQYTQAIACGRRVPCWA
jgi:gluconokinase